MAWPMLETTGPRTPLAGDQVSDVGITLPAVVKHPNIAIIGMVGGGEALGNGSVEQHLAVTASPLPPFAAMSTTLYAVGLAPISLRLWRSGEEVECCGSGKGT
ncbi:MAG: hypothetical protein IPL64_04415 [Flavobacteriales bacterium]|nr:hypothetical protein [Flavobacteriales bacterium]